MGREGSLYNEVQCIMGNGHKGAPTPTVNSEMDTTQNITFHLSAGS